MVKVLLAPLVVLIASLLANRVGPARAGFFVGLPTTSLPFLLTMDLSHGLPAAVIAASGSLTGQLACVLFCVAYVRTGRFGWVAAMPLALVIGVVGGLPTLFLPDPVPRAALVFVAAAVGLLTWPPTPETPPRPTPGWSIPLRMLLALLTVAGVAALEPRLGTVLAGAAASLPTVLIVMCPLLHRLSGPDAAIGLAAGTIASIPGTAGFLLVIVLCAPALGLWPALAIGLAAIVPVTAGLARGVSAAERLTSGRSAKRPAAA